MALPIENNRRYPSKQVRNTLNVVLILFGSVALIICGIILIRVSNLQSEQIIIETTDNFHTFQMNLTQEQTEILNQFRQKVSPNLTHKFMDSATFLTQWLVEKDWDLEDAEEMLMQHLQWRKDYEIDELKTEDIDPEYQTYMDGVDREGRPVITVNIGQWDVAKALVTGKQRQLLRSNFLSVEISYRVLRDAQKKNPNITQLITIYNLEGFSMARHGCWSCIPHHITAAFALEDNYPNYGDVVYKMIVINSPDAFHLLKYLVPSGVSSNMEVYGFNKAEWKKVILSYISPEQIRPEFGGTKEDHDDS